MATKASPAPQRDGQYAAHKPNPTFPHWGRDRLDHTHAVFAVVAHLRSLGLETWAPQVLRWLARFDGMERWLEKGEEPCTSVRDLLACRLARHNPARPDPHGEDVRKLKQSLVDDLLQLPFLRYCAYWGRGLIVDDDAQVWNPLSQPWLEFVDQAQPGQDLMVFVAERRARAHLAAHRAFLLQP